MNFLNFESYQNGLIRPTICVEIWHPPLQRGGIPQVWIIQRGARLCPEHKTYSQLLSNSCYSKEAAAISTSVTAVNLTDHRMGKVRCQSRDIIPSTSSRVWRSSARQAECGKVVSRPLCSFWAGWQPSPCPGKQLAGRLLA